MVLNIAKSYHPLENPMNKENIVKNLIIITFWIPSKRSKTYFRC